MKRLFALVFPLLPLLAAPLHAAGIPITGRVLTPDGKAAPGVRVSLIPELPGLESAKLELVGKAEPAAAASVSTDAAGAFRLTAPDAGMWRVRVESPGLAPLEAPLLPLTEEMDLPDARLVPGSGLQVKVTDPSGRPVAGAWVRAENPRLPFRSIDLWQLPLRRVAFTDAGGTATLPRAADEVLTVRAAAPGFLVAEQKNVRGGGAALRLATAPARRLVVRDPQGKPVAGAFVRLAASGWLAGRTPESGLLDLAVPAVGVDLRIEAADGRRLSYRLRPAKPEETGPAVAVLKPAAPASGKVVSARDGRPVPGALAWTVEDPGVVVRAGADGTFRLPNLPEDSGARAAAPGFFSADGRTDGGRVPTLALEPRLRTVGVVVDEAGRPVAGARLKASLLPGPGLSRSLAYYSSGGSARSNASGRFALTALAADAAYDLRTEQEGFAPARQELPAREAGAQAPELRIVLRAGRTAFGVVVDANQRPVAGAQAALQPTLPKDPLGRLRASRDKPERYSAPPTGADGRFELKDLPAGTFDLTVRGRGFAPLTVPALVIPEGKGATDLGTVALAAGAALHGLVVDAQGNPVEEAEVRAKAAQRERFPALPSRDPGPADALSGADGAFVLEDRSPGESLDLTVSHPGYGPASVPGVTAPREAPVRIVLQATARVSGHTVDPDGKPVAGAAVSVSEEEATATPGGHSLQRWTGREHSGVTDDEGGFAFDGVSPGPIAVRAQAPHRQRAELRNLEVKAGQDLAGLEVVLSPGAAVEGRVLSPEGRPVPGAEVSVLEPSQDNFGFSSLRATTDGDGQYRIEGTPPGKRTLEARAEGYRRGVRDVEVSARTVTVDFELERGLEVSGRVVDDGGNPVPGARLTLSAGRDFSLNTPRALSGADGAFRLTGLQDGAYTLRVNKAGYTPADPRGQTVTLAGTSVNGLEVRLSGGGTITGRLTGLEFSQLSRVRVWAESEFNSGQVDPEGTYRISHLPPDDWTVTAVVPDTPLHAEGHVKLEPGVPEARLDLDFGGGHTLSGVVLSNGAPLAGASLLLSRRQTVARQSTVSDHEGGFRFGGLEDGAYALDVTTPKGARHHESVELAGDQTIRVELRTASLAGRVIDAEDSSPVSGAAINLISLVSEELSAPFSDVTTDARGAFRVPEVGDGAWKLRTTREGYAQDERQVRVDGASPEEIEIRLKPTQGVTVEAVLQTGQPPERLRVAALDGNGTLVSTGVFPTGENGRTRISNVPPGSWQLLVEADLSGPAVLSATVPGPAVHAALPPAGRVYVQIPALAGDPAEAKAVLTGPGGVYRDFDWEGTVRSEWPCHNGRVNLLHVPAGVWQVAVRAGDGRTWSGTVTVTPGGEAGVGLK